MPSHQKVRIVPVSSETFREIIKYSFLKKNHMQAVTIGTGFYVPGERITNEFFDGKTVCPEYRDSSRGKPILTTTEWILQRSGIEERRRAAPNQECHHQATSAVQDALENAGKTSDDLEGIIVATVTDHQVFPNCAQKVREELKAKNARVCYDINTACAGFPRALANAVGEMNISHLSTTPGSGIYAVVGVEKLTNMIDYSDLRPNDVLFGDGAGAVILEVSEETNRGLFAKYDKTKTEGGNLDLIYRSPQRLLNMTDGRKVFRVGVQGLETAYHALMEKTGWQKEDIIFIPHQANLRMIEKARVNLGLEERQVVSTIAKFGNTSAASIPISLAVAFEEDLIQPNTKVIMVGFGAGMVFSGAAVIV